MEYVNCNLCKCDDTRVLFKKRDKFGIADDEFNVVECRHCGLAYINPRPSQQEIGKFYPETYSWKEKIEAGPVMVRLVKRLEKRYRYHLLRREVSKVGKVLLEKNGRVLDIGCGAGDRLDVFENRGFETVGVETSDAAEYAKKHLKLNVIKGDLFSASFPDGCFDIITLYHVLEHTHDPAHVCREIYRILKPGGLLVIQVPNKESLQYRLFGKEWSAFDVPRDLYYFGTGTVLSLLKKAGFGLMDTDHYMNWWHPPTLVISLFPSLDPQRSWEKERAGGSSVFQRAAWILCTLMAGPFTHFESWTKRGAIVTFYARKENLH